MSFFQQLVIKTDAALRVKDSFDIIKRALPLAGGKSAVLYYIDGFVKDEIYEKIFEFFMKQEDPLSLRYNIPYVEVEETTDFDTMIKMVLSGATLLFVEGLDTAMVIDTRTYPNRGVEEPDNDRVLRGPRDGFTEVLVFNTVLLRRRIRDTALTVKLYEIGDSTKTDIALCYLENRADPAFVKRMKKRLSEIDLKALNFGEQSLAEVLVKGSWFNPFPKVRYTERPDSAAASVLEGSVIIICDNTPSVMILPTSVFDFLQESDDFYLAPMTGSYLRIVRLGIFMLSLLLTPVWYLLVKNPTDLPPWLEFIKLDGEVSVPVLLQLFIIEFAIDGLKIASMNTPSTLNSSLSIVGGLILGDFAVAAGWLIPETVLYMAFVAMANFTQPSYELGYAFKFLRMLLLVLIALFNYIGFFVGIALSLVLVATNKTVDGQRRYLYPLIPWNATAMKRLFFRIKLISDRAGKK